MCCHGLKDKCNHKPHMKPSTLRGTVKLCKVVKWCICAPGEHQQLQGHSDNGDLRTHVAQEYTWLYCFHLIDDFIAFLKIHMQLWTAFFPVAGDDIQAIEPLLHEDEQDWQPQTPPENETADDIERRAREIRAMEPRSKAPPAKPPPRPPGIRQPGTPTDLPKAPKPSWNPLDELTEKWDADEQEALLPNPASDSVALPDEAPAIPDDEQRQLARVVKPALESHNSLLNEIAQKGARLPNGGVRTYQTGNPIRFLQEMFGTPHMKHVKLAILTRKPSVLSEPEPMVSRRFLEFGMLLTKDSDDVSWSVGPWKPMSEFKQVFKRKPAWSIVVFATNLEDHDLADHFGSTPIEDVSERKELDRFNTSSLPHVLQILSTGDEDSKIQMLLAIHKRKHHRKAHELRKILVRSNVPFHVLSLAEKAVSLCDACRRSQAPHSALATKFSIASQLNR